MGLKTVIDRTNRGYICHRATVDPTLGVLLIIASRAFGVHGNFAKQRDD